MNPYHKSGIIEQYEKKQKLKFLFFWGHQPSKDGSVTKSCFSQWWIAPFNAEGHRYPSAEHWMMVQKALLFGDDQVASEILHAVSPAAAKKLGRAVRYFDPILWDEHKYEIVKKGNEYKFSQHSELGQFLLNTGSRILVEASPVDPVWGIGLAADHAHAENPLFWRGENLLGFALMEIRDKLRQLQKQQHAH